MLPLGGVTDASTSIQFFSLKFLFWRTSSVVDDVEMVDIENAGFILMVGVFLMQLVCSIAET